ncbi:MAG: 16S rRNA (cytosine(1402)-N(4))-methyltransferase RsmH, partial [Bacteroidota bacterium]|nr:16S rRNA (cytosine(1402)-N(4))-methyltransferase RsmH [Bacteroidota bacterium]
SYQFDTPERGFSYRFNGELDMRMNVNSSTTAYQVVNEYDEQNLVRILVSYGEFKRGEARKIFRKIDENRSIKSIKTTYDLQEILDPIFPTRFLNKNLSKIFQSIRIEVNEEMQALKELLNQLVDCLNPNGVAAFITYHSIEDRMVKNFFKSGNTDGELTKDFYGKILKPFELVNKKPIVPSDVEINENPRARSAKLRMAKRL